jgi:catechol 2,3-dioxygenase
VELARVLLRLINNRYPLHGAADHLVSEAIYLSDPEGNGLELYSDRNPDDWPRQNGQIAMATDPLDFQDLLAQAKENPDPWQHIHSGTDIGHVHLSVSDLHRSEGFYAGLLGLDITQRTYPGALFFSAGGYHHHVGTNIWESRTPPPLGPIDDIAEKIPDDASRRQPSSPHSKRVDLKDYDRGTTTRYRSDSFRGPIQSPITLR